MAGALPQVVSVTALTTNGGYGLDQTGTVNASITIDVTFSSLVTVNTTNGKPTLLLNAGSGAVAVYNATVLDTLPILQFIYTIGANQSTPQLDYASISALQLNGGTILSKPFPMVAANLTLPAPGSAASLAGTSSLAVGTVTGAIPAVANVASTAINGTYGVGASIPITVSLSLPVTVTGNTRVQLALANGQTALASYVKGSGTNILTFDYIVAAGQTVPRLDDGGFLVLNGSTNLPLPAPGKPGSLGNNNRIAIDTATATAPTVTAVTTTVPDGSYLAGNVIPIQVQFSRPVIVTGTPLLAMAIAGSNSALASYSGGSGTNALTFDYTVAAGQQRRGWITSLPRR